MIILKIRAKLLGFWVSILVAFTSGSLCADESTVEVTALNYVQAKTAIQFDKYLARAHGKVNTFSHGRRLVGIDQRSSKRLNRDTLYSVAIVDISEGASLTIPEAHGRYMSVQVINEHGFTNKIFHDVGQHDLTVKKFDTPFVLLLVRILVSDSIPDDLAKAHALQDKLTIISASQRLYTHPDYDAVSMGATTELLLLLSQGIHDNAQAAGTKAQVNPIKQLLLTAYGFGTLPESESYLLTVTPNLTAEKAYALTVKDVPVDGFWSLAMYNKDGYFEKNKNNIYSYNDKSAKKNIDGSITLHFGGDPLSTNYMPITEGWNYVVRMYRPRAELLDGRWIFPSLVELVQ
ncbi:MAG: DUF1214 domain-containing protein [Porticoccaceae bacterium]|nr:DUF1214 domain-containing protein [Porticoccaceae bacterium]